MALPLRREAVDGALERGAAAGAGQAVFGRLRRLVALGQCQHALLGVDQQAVAVHGDAVASARRKCSAIACAADLLTSAVEMISNALATAGIGPRGSFGLGLPARQQLLAAAPAGQQADADLDQAHIGLGMRLHRAAMQQDLAAAAQRHARRARRRPGTGAYFSAL